MKPTIPETGSVIRLDGEMAVVLLHGGKACKGCGAAAIGLCKPSGGISTLTVRNTGCARPGDTVTVTLDKDVRRKGFLLAYIIPILCFLGGSILGHILGRKFSLPSLDVAAGFISLLAASTFTFRKLRRLNSSSTMKIKKIVSEGSFRPWV